ncbi:uncharacterized protein LOC132203645 [Neocloeon triangulifer]|uniref:uncharacterized protein LOC132203645 n=1 Tax=Neocloeon triangulifer TaxID=2078957 RepID=UPI00286F6FBD|nr:uncharacterized protein LOC132203645 [Neocloeon triangulifer]
MGSSRNPNFLDKIADTLETNSKGVQYGLYGLGFAGLVVAFRKVRPIQKFSNPRDVPRSFIKKKEPLNGVVKGAELRNGAAVLQIAHTPPLPLGREGKPPYLPVSLCGVSPTVNGLSWLQIVLDSQPVTFTVLSTNPDTASSLVTFNGKDVGSRLVELGFARVTPADPTLTSSEAYKKLHAKLVKSERWAELNGNGMWWGHAPFYIRIANKACSRVRLLVAQAKSAKRQQPAAVVAVR